VLLPCLSAIAATCTTPRYSWLVTITSPLLLLGSALSAVYIFFSVWNETPFQVSFSWFAIAGKTISAGIYLDNIAVLMLLVVTVVSFLVHIYSTGYMAGDAGVTRYFAMLGFFTFAMLGIVLSNNILLMFVFWELVGFSSYMLIGHWQEKPAAAAAAKKAFIFNRVGDAGFLIGMMLLWTHTGTFDLLQLSARTEIFSTQTIAALCIFCGVMGKSAQFPLLTWLPDAMEGPTPVSALIHAATMVAAGVFLLARVDFLFTPVSLHVVAIIGITTAVMAGLSAWVQTDIKKILAYSTISQLGLMVTAVGAGASSVAVLHLFTHAFFKACLFLCAGIVIHVLHQAQHQAHTHFDVQDIRNLGGLRRRLPFTFLCFTVSSAALAGVPFFSGFLSKDAIFSALIQWAGNGMSWKWIIVILAFAVSFITVLYSVRLVWSVFMGEERQTASLPVVEPPVIMRAPVAWLAVCSVWLIVSLNPLHYQGWLLHGLGVKEEHHGLLIPFLSAVWVLLALALAIFRLREKSFGSPLLFHNFYLDNAYDKLIRQPSQKVSGWTGYMDRAWIDGFLHAIAYVHVTFSFMIGWVDRALVDCVVDGAAYTARSVGNFTRSFQGGKIQRYILWTTIAILLFLIWTVF
jgi:NADH-quinone oxidoreductase subunit L